MKKGLLTLLTVGLLVLGTSFIGRQTPVEEVFTLTFSSSELQTLWYALKKSNAEHSLVSPLEDKIQQQVDAQVRERQALKARQDSATQAETKKKKN